LGQHSLGLRVRRERREKKSLLKAERIYRSGDYFHLVCAGEFVVGVKKIERHSLAKVFLLAAFKQLMSISLLKY